MKFIDANTVNLSGYIWQEYDKEMMDTTRITPEIFFPENAPQAFSIEMSPFSTLTEEHKIIQSWNFRVSVRTQFNYTIYPFDQQVVQLQLWYPDLQQNVLLVPNLKSYVVSNPTTLPGVDKDLVSPEWTPVMSYFDYKTVDYGTNFGVSPTFETQRPELYFNIVINRKFVGPFITNIFPLFVIALLLYTVMIASTTDSVIMQRVGFSGLSALGIASAFFFVIIIAHNELRKALEVQYITYLDYFYFFIYFLLFIFSLNAILFTFTDKYKFISAGNNLYPRLMYWPLFMGVLFTITFIVFY